MDFVNLFITVNGRINRAKLWLAALVFVAIQFLMTGLVYLADQNTVVVILGGIVSLLISISGIVIGIKRLHDRNKSGWYMLLFYAAPFFLFAIGFMMGSASGSSLTVSGGLVLVSMALSIWTIVELGCRRGTIGQNKYGPDPLAPEVLTPPVRTHA